MQDFRSLSIEMKVGIAALVIALLALGAWFFYDTPRATTTPAPAGEDIDLSSISTTTHVGGYTIEPVLDGEAPPAPDYKKPIPMNASVSSDVRAAIEAQHADVRKALDANTTDINAWTRLGVLHKIAGDYAGAAEKWIYVTQVWREDPIAYANLGALYRVEGKIAQAKTAYATAIAKAKAANLKDLAASYQLELDSL